MVLGPEFLQQTTEKSKGNTGSDACNSKLTKILRRQEEEAT